MTSNFPREVRKPRCAIKLRMFFSSETELNERITSCAPSKFHPISIHRNVLKYGYGFSFQALIREKNNKPAPNLRQLPLRVLNKKKRE